MSGDLMGTLRYMSPEQALAKPYMIDHRTDIHSLGVTLYELLTLKPAIGGRDRQEVLRKIAFGEPRPPRRINKSIPVELETIVLKATEKNPADRYATAKDLADDFRRFLEDKPIRAKRPGFVQTTKKWARRHKSVVFSLASVIFLGAITAGVLWFQHHSRLQDVFKSVHDSLTGAQTALEARDLSLARQKLAEGEGKIANDRGSLASLVEELDKVRGKLDAYAQAQKRFQKFMELTTKASEPLLGSNLRGIRLLQDALSLYGIMDRTNGDSALEDGLLAPEQVAQLKKTIYQNLLVLADHGVRWWWADASGQLRWQGEARPGEDTSQEAKARESMVYLKKALDYHPPTRGYYWVRSKCWKFLGDTKAAEADAALVKQTEAIMGVDYFLSARDAGWATHYKDCKEAIRQAQMALLVEPTHDWSLEFLAKYLIAEKRYDEALLVANGLIAMRPEYADGYGHRAEIRGCQNRFEEALADYAKAMELAPNEHAHYNNRGLVYKQMGKLTEALADNNKVLELDPEDKCKLHYRNRGVCFLEMGRFDEAMADFAKALLIDPGNAQVFIQRSDVYRAKAEYEQALNDSNKAIELNPIESRAYQRRALAYKGLKRYDEMMADFTKALELDAKHPVLACCVAYHLANGPPQVRNLERALQLAEQAVQAEPANGFFLSTLGMVHYRLGSYQKAIEHLEQALKSQEKRETAPSLLFLAMSYHHLGRRDKAHDNYQKALAWMKEHETKNKPWAEDEQKIRQEAEQLIKNK
jgi:tetratricopeptide (TPR) repeat protein